MDSDSSDEDISGFCSKFQDSMITPKTEIDQIIINFPISESIHIISDYRPKQIKIISQTSEQRLRQNDRIIKNKTTKMSDIELLNTITIKSKLENTEVSDTEKIELIKEMNNRIYERKKILV